MNLKRHTRSLLAGAALLSTGMLPIDAAAIERPAHLASSAHKLQLARGGSFSRKSGTTWRAAALPRATQAWNILSQEVGPIWAQWDDATGIPRRILTVGVPAPDTTASAAAAERFARGMLARHLPLLAPGATVDDFVLVSNDLSADIRTIGFEQHVGGHRVVGGQVSFRFKYDHLVAIASEALPHVSVSRSSHRVEDTLARTRAQQWIEDTLAPKTLRHTDEIEGPMVLALDEAGTQYREVVRAQVDTLAPASRYWVYLDAATGEPVARQQQLHFASATLQYNVPDRGPLGSRRDRPASNIEVFVDGAPQLTGTDGSVNFGGASTQIVTGLQGPYAAILNEAGGLAQEFLIVPDGGSATWNAASDPLVDAQLSALIHTGIVQEYVRPIASGLDFLNEQVPVTVNIADECNAFSDGFGIYFFQSSPICENTARLADVVYHEYGHSIHTQSIIPGVGAFDGALSEGISDYLSATITDDPGVARGFFYDETPIRDLDPNGFEYRWPEDNGEVHDAGRIIGGALWDLRTLLINKYGRQEGIRIADTIWYESIRRAVDMPSMYPEALVVDDNDGDIANGTPNACEINAAFGAHGLFSAGADGERVWLSEDPDGLRAHVSVALPSFPDCPIGAGAVLQWRLRDSPGAEGSAVMEPGVGEFTALLPAIEPGQVLQYQVQMEYSVGTIRSLPDNLAAPWFEQWIGAVEPIYCTSFENLDGWSFGGTGDDWSVAAPRNAADDPDAPFGPDPLVLGNDLEGDGLYSPFSDTFATSPIITVPAGYQSVRLHYQRWLNVEDGFYDQAMISADNVPVWANYGSDVDFLATVHHRDRQWMFHDVDLTEAAADGQVQLEFRITSDAGLEFGGWTLDELCVVGIRSAASNGCGNGVIDPGETCDDGNLNDGDGCSSACQAEGRPDPGEDGDDEGFEDAGAEDGDTEDGGDLDNEGLQARGCACQAQPTDTSPLAGLGLWLFGLWVHRRRGSRLVAR